MSSTREYKREKGGKSDITPSLQTSVEGRVGRLIRKNSFSSDAPMSAKLTLGTIPHLKNLKSWFCLKPEGERERSTPPPPWSLWSSKEAKLRP